MIDILAQTKQIGLIYGIGSSVAVSGLILWVIKMQIQKVVKHVDDRTAHLDPANPLVKEELYKIETDNIKADIKENKNSVKAIHQRIDELNSSMVDNTKTILNAINDKK